MDVLSPQGSSTFEESVYYKTFMANQFPSLHENLNPLAPCNNSHMRFLLNFSEDDIFFSQQIIAASYVSLKNLVICVILLVLSMKVFKMNAQW